MIDTVKSRLQPGKLSNWKAWRSEDFTNIHEKIVTYLNKCLQNGKTPEWMTKGRTCLILKNEKRGNETSNFRLITCLHIMFWQGYWQSRFTNIWKEKILPDEQKGCRQIRGTEIQLMIDKVVMKNCKRRVTNFGVAWIY